MGIRTLNVAVAAVVCAAIAASAAGGAGAAAKTCPTLADGRWRIVSYGFAPGVVGMSEDEARGFVGKSVTVRPDQVVFAGERCEVRARQVRGRTAPTSSSCGLVEHLDEGFLDFTGC